MEKRNTNKEKMKRNKKFPYKKGGKNRTLKKCKEVNLKWITKKN